MYKQPVIEKLTTLKETLETKPVGSRFLCYAVPELEKDVLKALKGTYTVMSCLEEHFKVDIHSNQSNRFRLLWVTNMLAGLDVQAAFDKALKEYQP